MRGLVLKGAVTRRVRDASTRGGRSRRDLSGANWSLGRQRRRGASIQFGLLRARGQRRELRGRSGGETRVRPGRLHGTRDKAEQEKGNNKGELLAIVL